VLLAWLAAADVETAANYARLLVIKRGNMRYVVCGKGLDIFRQLTCVGPSSPPQSIMHPSTTGTLNSPWIDLSAPTPSLHYTKNQRQ